MVPFKMTCHETGVHKWRTCRIHSRTAAIPSSQRPSLLWSFIFPRNFSSIHWSLHAVHSDTRGKGGKRMWIGFIWLRMWILGTRWSVCRNDAIRAGWRSLKLQTWIRRIFMAVLRRPKQTPGYSILAQPHHLKSFPFHRSLPPHHSFL